MPSLLGAPLYRYTYRYTFHTSNGDDTRIDWRVQTTAQSSDWLAHENAYGNVRCEYVSKEPFGNDQDAIFALYVELLSNFDPTTDFSDDERIRIRGNEFQRRLSIVASKINEPSVAKELYNTRIRDATLPSMWSDFLIDDSTIAAWRTLYRAVPL